MSDCTSSTLLTITRIITIVTTINRSIISLINATVVFPRGVGGGWRGRDVGRWGGWLIYIIYLLSQELSQLLQQTIINSSIISLVNAKVVFPKGGWGRDVGKGLTDLYYILTITRIIIVATSIIYRSIISLVNPIVVCPAQYFTFTFFCRTFITISSLCISQWLASTTITYI